MTSRDLIRRRELLRAFLGAPLAGLSCLAGCGRSAAPLPEGRFVGPSVEWGHRLRDGGFPAPHADDWEPVDVLIVGAGVAGLSAAWALRRDPRGRKLSLAVLELESDAGGTARSGASSVAGYPWGAHYVPLPTREQADLVSLFDEMGIWEGFTPDGDPIPGEQHLVRDPEERVFFRGRWYEGLYLHAGASAQDLEEFAAFQKEIDRWVELRDASGRRPFTLPVAACSDDAEFQALDRITMAEWLDERGWRSPRLRWWVDYACRDDYGLRVGQTSAWAGLFYFAARLPHAGATPQPFLTWPEGNGRIVRHLAEGLRRELRLGWGVSRLTPHGFGQPLDAAENDAAGEHVDATAWDVLHARPHGFRARRVIFAGPSFLAPRVVADWQQAPPPHYRDFHYGAWLVANLHLRNRPRSLGFPAAWDNVLYESPSLGYVSATHQRLLDHGPTVLTYYFPFCDDSPAARRRKLLGLEWSEAAEIVLSDLEIAHPGLRSLVERLDVMRWGHAMIQPRPGFVTGPARQAAARPYRGIHFAHSDLSGLALFEEAFSQGVRAARELLDGLEA